MVLLGQHLSQLDQSADRQPAFRELIRDDREPRDETGRLRSPEGGRLREPELANAVIEERRVSELAIELPLGKAGQLDDELDYEMPLVPNQVGEAAVEIARSGRFHGNSLARASSPSCEGRRRPVGARSSHGCFPPPGCAPAHGRARRTGPGAASLAAALGATGFWPKRV